MAKVMADIGSLQRRHGIEFAGDLNSSLLDIYIEMHFIHTKALRLILELRCTWRYGKSCPLTGRKTILAFSFSQGHKSFLTSDIMHIAPSLPISTQSVLKVWVVACLVRFIYKISIPSFIPKNHGFSLLPHSIDFISRVYDNCWLVVFVRRHWSFMLLLWDCEFGIIKDCIFIILFEFFWNLRM